MKPKHLKWDEMQMQGCGACQSPFIIRMYDEIGIYRCLECNVNLTSAMANRRQKIADYDLSEENRARVKAANPNKFIATLTDEEGNPYLYRPETDDEMRTRGDAERDAMSNLPNVGGRIIPLKFKNDDFHRMVNIGTNEMQSARVLHDCLKALGHESLHTLTQELHELRAFRDSMMLRHSTVADDADVRSDVEMMKEFNPAAFALSTHGQLYRD